jgi:hypothetical protein
VDDDGDRVAPLTFGKAEVAELLWVGAVADPLIGRRRRQFIDILRPQKLRATNRPAAEDGA